MQGILDQFDPLAISKPPEAASSTNATPSHENTSSSKSTQSSNNQEQLQRNKSNPSRPSSSSSSSSLGKKGQYESKTNNTSNNNGDSSLNEKRPSSSNSQDNNINGAQSFDFQRFLDLLRHKSADPIARYLKSFLNEFNKRNWTADEQIKIITDFKIFISGKMSQCPPFSSLSDQETDNALEGMEKLIMNRLYTKTFSPEIPDQRRFDSHEEDVIRDRVLDDKMKIWRWIEGRHLDIPNKFLRNGESFVKLASDELRKINHYRAPRDKVVCILNCCKVIFGLLRQTSSEENADGFLPILIYVVIKAHPASLISNINYIQRFRNPEKLFGEAGYYLSSLQGAVSFIETLDRQSLSITEEEFNHNMDKSIASSKPDTPPNPIDSQPPSTPDRSRTPDPSYRKSSESGLSRPDTSPRHQQGNLTPSAVLQNSAGLLAVPFKTFSKYFESEPPSPPSNKQTSSSSRDTSESATPALDSSSKLEESTMKNYSDSKMQDTKYQAPDNNSNYHSRLSPEELAAKQISAEEEEARRISQQEFESVVDTLAQMFPSLERSVIVDVATAKQGRVGAAVDACLALVQ